MARRLGDGTAPIIKEIHTKFLDVEIASGSVKGRRVFLRNMALTPSDLEMPFAFRRTQFPIRLSYAVKINKFQCKTLGEFGIYLNIPYFAHGKL